MHGSHHDLPPTQRLHLTWHLDGYTNAEIASRTGKSEAAVRKNISRALTTLSIKLKACLMTSDPHRKDGTTPGAEDVAAVYAFLGRASDDLLGGLKRVLPVEAAISATIGPDSSVPKAPSRSRKARRARRIRRWARRPSTG